MSRSLSSSDVLYRDAAAQATTLPDGRVLVRHAGGVSLVGGVRLADLRRVLAEIKGGRTVADLCAALAGCYDEDAVCRLLASLVGEMVHVGGQPSPPWPPSPNRTPFPPGEGGRERPEREKRSRKLVAPLSRGSGSAGGRGAGGEGLVVLAGHGRTAKRLAGLLERAGFALSREAGEGREGGLDGAGLVVCALERVPYRTLFDLQAACLAAGAPSLFLTADPDGVRLGPTTIPGVSPCFACAQLAAFGFLRLEPGALLSSVEPFRAGAVASEGFEQAAAALLLEVEEILSGAGEPSLLTQVLQFLPHGGTRRLPVERVLDCPLCGSVRPPAGKTAARAGRILAETVERRPSRAVPAEPEGLVRSVGILGGGTAGYLAALALRKKVPHLDVTLIESSDVPIIGVGEATTPLMPQFLHVDLGLDVHQLFREVRPTVKLGIRFLWGAPGDGDFHYPFGPVHVLEPVAYGGDLRDCSLQSMLMAAGALPLYAADGDTGSRGWTCRLGTEAAYHLDNERFVAYLKRRAAEHGVERIEANVEHVETAENGREVRALVARDGRRFAFDLYIDGSGFRSLLIEKALGSPWISFETSLWTDRAVVAPVPHGGAVRPYTTAETMSCGWCWSTPQADADHRGYVFASAFQTPEEAEAEMRRANPGMGEARLVRFRAGRHGHFWQGNVVALGNAYGFVEPLESTALHMLIRQIGLLVRSFPLRRGERGFQALLDRKVGAWWDYLRWFLAIHYRFNRRVNSPFWRACREEVDVAAYSELLAAFRERGPLSYDPASRTAFDYPDPLWGPEGIDVLLLGQGVPTRLPRPLLARAAWCDRLRLARAAVAQAERHERALDLLAERPELLESMVNAFRAAGPAFSVG